MRQITIELHPKLPPIPEKETWLRMLTLFIRFCLPHLSSQGAEPFKGPVHVLLLPAKGHEYDNKMTSGFYQPGSGLIGSRQEGRALADVMRTIAHELIHQRQDELGELTNKKHPDIGGRVENEANALAGMLLKQFVLDADCRWIHQV